CKDFEGHNVSSSEYRLPYCCAFLRPTDKLQNPNKLLTTGYHLPICKIDKVKRSGPKNHVVSLSDILTTAIKPHSFEELFNMEILGSRWLEKAELEELYRRTRILEPKENI